MASPGPPQIPAATFDLGSSDAHRYWFDAAVRMDADWLLPFDAFDDGDVSATSLGSSHHGRAVWVAFERVAQRANRHFGILWIEARSLDECSEVPSPIGVGEEVDRDGLHIHQVPENTHRNTLLNAGGVTV
jgi:hypothetical protein